MQEKRAHNLTEFVFNQTKQTRIQLQAKYNPLKWKYFQSMYEQLISCYEQNITKEVYQQLNSDSMLNYFSCYKKTLRKAKDNNKKIYDEGLRNEIKLKQCIEIKSTITKSSADFEKDRNECFEDYVNNYQALYSSVFLPQAKVEESKSKENK